MKQSHVLQAFYSRAWALEPNTHAQIEQLLQARAEGQRVAEDELAVWEAASPYGAAKNGQANRGTEVAIIPVHGIMLGNATGLQRMSGATDSRDLAEAVRMAADDPNVREIVLDVDSPGGEVAAVDPAVDAVQYARERKRVTAVSQGMMASAAYWLSSQADRIVASPNAMVGSISVLYTHVDKSAANKRMGVTVTHLASGSKKALGNPNEPLTDEGREEARRIITEYHDAFVQAVADGRGLDPDTVQARWADGRVEVGTTAHQIGMTDEVGTLDDVLASIQQEAASQPAAGMRVKGGSIVTLKEVRTLLASADRVDAETDEGTRKIVALDVETADKVVQAVEQGDQELTAAQQAAQEAKAEVASAQRRDMAAKAIATANLPPVSAERDAAFAAEVADAAVKAKSDEAAKAEIDKRIQARQADLKATRSDNTPGIPTPHEDARARESKRALASIRRSTGLPN